MISVAGLLGHFFFQSNAIKKFYLRTLHSPNWAVRVAGFTLIAILFLFRTAKQFRVLTRNRIGLGGAALAFCAATGLWALVLLPGALVSWVAWRVASQPGDGVGHRAGWEGYEGL